jgi:hypothetical protein
MSGPFAGCVVSQIYVVEIDDRGLMYLFYRDKDFDILEHTD